MLAGSLALVADAGHMATDVLALGASLVATQIAGPGPTDPVGEPTGVTAPRFSLPDSRCC